MRRKSKGVGAVGRMAVALVVLGCTAAQVPSPAPVQTAQEVDGRPVLIDRDALWPGVVLICIVGLFLMAALVGPLVRANQFEDELPENEKRN